ncbi:MAG TPA: hypothetical protein VHX60_07940 [Acidobacteriaceae bacterium]|jgi:hypothetical protein|nr:hypothetical protein [Acidobacteriaceae bacterium]
MFTPGKRSILIRLIELNIVAFALAAAVPLRAQSSQFDFHRSIEGAWWVSVTQYDCATGVKRPPFSSMLLFSTGGTLVETTSNPGFLPGQRGTGVGTWARSEEGTYTASDLAFILFTGGPFQQGTQKLTHSITLDRDADRFTDEATVQFYDVTGTLLMSGCATATASRLH